MSTAVSTSSPADAAGRLLAAAARAADRGLDAVGLTPPPLNVPPAVLADLERFFAGTIDPTAVTIRRGHVPGVPHPRAFALPGLIYLGADPGIVGGPGGSGQGTSRPRATPTLVHELVHIWQGRYLGPRYIVQALGEQIRLGRGAYDWRAVLDSSDPGGVDPGSTKPDSVGPDSAIPGGTGRAFPVEAHAQLVSEAYAARHGFAPAAALSGRDGHPAAVDRVLAQLRAGDASTLRGRTV